MFVVVVGGHSRNVGKTSVVTGLISAMPERNWVAVKISQHGHGISQPFAITEERDRSRDSDTARYLRAGAVRALWVRTQPGSLALAMPNLRRQLEGAENIIVESNSVLEFLRPDVYLAVIDPATEDFKASALKYLPQASAIVLHDAGEGANSLPSSADQPCFRIHPPPFVTDELVHFVRLRLAGAQKS